MITRRQKETEKIERIKALDKKLSNRKIALDPKGYFLIHVDHAAGELEVQHFSNDIDNLGRATDPKTGKPLGCSSNEKRLPEGIYRGKSAKEVGILLTENPKSIHLSKLDHALYLGRELQRAEMCLVNGETYVQD